LDETIQKQQLEEIKHLSFHDQLTGVYNRHYFNEELIRIDQPRNYPIGIIMADVNGLKLVNDAFGHQEGDELIQQASKIMKNSLRSDDIIARIGGDEFVVLLPKTNELELKQIIERMNLSTQGIGVNDLGLSIAFGYSLKKRNTKAIQDVIREAENRMYKSKLLTHTSQRRDVINSIIATLHEKHPREEAHSNRVSDYATIMATALNYDNERLVNIKTAGMLHDIGKIAIDYSILDKPEHLSKIDDAEIKKHPEIGYRILSSSGIFIDIAEIVLSHHEFVNGHGYPRNLKSANLMEEAKILCICDAFDAMTSDRSYRKALSVNQAIDELVLKKDIQFDAYLVDLFIQLIHDKKIKVT
jgi:diguanylate cyclase (GGDEF)-like protein/putative nucleotidyltransferase with HDIG domain